MSKGLGRVREVFFFELIDLPVLLIVTDISYGITMRCPSYAIPPLRGGSIQHMYPHPVSILRLQRKQAKKNLYLSIGLFQTYIFLIQFLQGFPCVPENAEGR